MMTREEREAMKALYTAAKKAGGGMLEALVKCQIEVCVNETPNVGGPLAGKRVAYIVWENELRERPEFVYPAAAMARAEVWLNKYAATKGWVVT